MIRIVGLGALLIGFIVPSAFAQFNLLPSRYVSHYRLNPDESVADPDTIYWERRIYANGFHSLTEIRDTAWLGGPISQKVINYGDLNQLDSIHEYQVNGSFENLTTSTVFEYPSLNEYVSHYYIVDNGNYQKQSVWEYVLNDDDQIIRATCSDFNSANQQMEYLYRYDHTYLASGKQDSSFRFDYINGSFELTQVIYWTFDNWERCIGRYYGHLENDQIVMDRSYENFYDLKGRLDYIHFNNYSTSGIPVLEKYFDYEHNNDGLVSFERVYKVNGPDTSSQWSIEKESFFEYKGGALSRHEVYLINSGSLYRLWDHRYVYSLEAFPAAIEASSSDRFSVKVFPNPSYQSIQIRSEKAISQLIIRDVTGSQLITVNQFPSTQCQVSVSALSPGMYFIETYSGSKALKTVSFIKG